MDPDLFMHCNLGGLPVTAALIELPGS